jgi:hypothetical protein
MFAYSRHLVEIRETKNIRKIIETIGLINEKIPPKKSD